VLSDNCCQQEYWLLVDAFAPRSSLRIVHHTFIIAFSAQAAWALIFWQQPPKVSKNGRRCILFPKNQSV